MRLGECILRYSAYEAANASRSPADAGKFDSDKPWSASLHAALQVRAASRTGRGFAAAGSRPSRWLEAASLLARGRSAGALRVRRRAADPKTRCGVGARLRLRRIGESTDAEAEGSLPMKLGASGVLLGGKVLGE